MIHANISYNDITSLKQLKMSIILNSSKTLNAKRITKLTVMHFKYANDYLHFPLLACSAPLIFTQRKHLALQTTRPERGSEREEAPPPTAREWPPK